MTERPTGDGGEGPRRAPPAPRRGARGGADPEPAGDPAEGGDEQKARVWRLFLQKLAAKHPNHPWLKEWTRDP